MPKSVKRALLAFVWLMSLTVTARANADCVSGAKSARGFSIVGSNTIILTGVPGGNILLKTFHFFYAGDSITVLKDAFCSFELSVLYVDGEVVDVNEVRTQLAKRHGTSG